MDEVEKICENIKKFAYDKSRIQQQISEIEEKRTQLAHQRNTKKKVNNTCTEINKLGKQIAELGSQSQELQNKLDFKFNEFKMQTNLRIDNSISEGIRKIRRIEEEIHELEKSISNQRERKAKYQIQKQEFYERFGRIPELSEKAIKESQIQEEKAIKNVAEIEKLTQQIKEIENEITELAKIKRDLKNGNLNAVVEGDYIGKEIIIEPLNIEEIEPIEEIYIEEFVEPEQPYIEEFKTIEEIQVEEFKEEKEFDSKPEEIAQTTNEKEIIDEIEALARAIVEQIVAQQTQDININKIEENYQNVAYSEKAEDIITFEEENKNENEEKVIIPLFGQKPVISNIIVKVENSELVYKAQMTDGKEVKIYPSKIEEENVLLRDKQNREECKEILVNYAISEYKIFDKKVVNKIDPLICELLIECAKKYNYNAQELIYNYAMTFSGNVENDVESVPEITYNLSYIEQSNLNSKERTIINKICKYAKKNSKIDIIESLSKFNRIKYVFKRLFAINNSNALPEAKY